MTMNTTIESAKEAVAERLSPALESFEDNVRENVREARRAITHGRHAAEDLAAGTALEVRRRPLMSVAVVGAAGAFAGCMFGFALGWQARRCD